MNSALLPTSWEVRLAADRDRAATHQSPELQQITAEVLDRAVRAGSLALVLTGSTARGGRTAISDLDYHLVGERPDLGRLPGDVDLVADSLERFQRRLDEGDDFVHWTVRHGCVVYDPHGVICEASRHIEREGLWPDAGRKFERAAALADLAEKVLAIQDRDAAQEHTRAALTSLARGLLLDGDTFPLARSELPAQLRDVGQSEPAAWLRRTIYESLTLSQLQTALMVVQVRLPSH